VYESIVVGTDGSPSAKRAVAQAAQLAESLGCTLHLVSAYEPLRGARIVGAPEGAAEVWKVRPDAQVESIVNEATAFLRTRGVQVEQHTLTGDPADALLEIAGPGDLIVVGSRGMHGVGRVLGSVPNTVSHRADCDVLIVATDAD
jgi:nucleotide-binding universal stress UspA family protein